VKETKGLDWGSAASPPAAGGGRSPVCRGITEGGWTRLPPSELSEDTDLGTGSAWAESMGMKKTSSLERCGL
jgi:hypothetical protein